MKCVAFLLLLIPLTPLSALLIGQPGETRNPPVITPPPQPRPEPAPMPAVVLVPQTSEDEQHQKTRMALQMIHEKLETEFSITPGNGVSRVVEIRWRHYLKDNNLTVKIGAETWLVEKLDLVGMLSLVPRVYSTPAINAATKTRTDVRKLAHQAKPREADRFESDALEKVRTSGTLITDIGSDEIRMVGAVHATSDCLKCHSERVNARGKYEKIEAGDVLGAFTYRLTRVNAAAK